MAKKELIFPGIESPTWKDLQVMAETVMEILGGPSKASKKLKARNYYTLAVCASLMLDEEKGSRFIFGKQWLTY